ncbi:MAG: hypothetical protein Q4C65_09720 [Eubacteriales bacterium]|nr:hypothetical protein [Eubacteriales bacterium]
MNKKYALIATILLAICLFGAGCFYGNTSSENTTSSSMNEDTDWSNLYRNIIANAPDYILDPYELGLGYDDYLYLGLHDFDGDNVPEFIFGDLNVIRIYTVENNSLKNIENLQMTKDWGGINGVRFEDNTLLLVNNGSDGGGYECFTYKDKYITGFYSDYEPETAIMNGNKRSSDAFFEIFDLEKLKKGTSLERMHMGEVPSKTAADLKFEDIMF